MYSRKTIRPSLFFFFTIALTESCNNSGHKHISNLRAGRPVVKWTFSQVKDSIIKFSGGKQFNTHLYDPKYLGQVENGTKAPFLIFSGRDCNECDENISIYIHSLSDGDISVENCGNRYYYPGTEKDYENDSVLYKARAFFGQVLPGIKGVIWYQQQLMEDRSFQKSVFLVKLNNGRIKDTVFNDIADLKLTMRLLKERRCKEIKGMNYSSEP